MQMDGDSMASEPHTDQQDAPEQEPDATRSESEPASDNSSDNSSGDGDFKYGEDETQDFVDRSKIDFDPEDGLYTGSAVDGTSDIPGPSEGDIREAQEEQGDDAGPNSGEKAAAEKFIEENDVDLDEARKGEAIAGSAQGKQQSGDGDESGDDESGDDKPGDDDRPKPG